MKPREFLALAAALGLLTGYAEVSLLGVQRYLMHRLLFLGPDVIWMAPTANALLFLLLAGLALLLARGGLARVSPDAAIGGGVGLGVAAVLFMYHPLYKLAAVLIATGCGVQAARTLGRHAPRVLPLARLVALGLGLVTLGLGIGLQGWRAWRERQQVAGLPPAAAGAPNVLLIILDTVRAMSLSGYGHDEPTSPNLDSLATRGQRFAHAFSTAPWTLPSHVSALTGRLPQETGVDWQVPLDDRFPTLAEVLASHGYRTGGFVANTTYCSEESGLARGFGRYEAYPVSLGMLVKSSSLGRALTGRRAVRRLAGNYQPLARKDAADINAALLRWVDRQEGRPFFAFLNYFDAHAPYLPPAPFDTRFGATAPRRNIALEAGGPWTEAEVAAQRNAYEGSIAYLDHRLGELFAALTARGLLDNTLVIVTSDHGEEFLEHGVMDHGNTLYRPSVEIPLILHFPGRVPAGGVIAAPVSLRDLPATITDLVGGTGAAAFPGRSLARFWQDSAAAQPDPVFTSVSYAANLPPEYPVSTGGLEGVIADGYRYIRWQNGREELYHFGLDPLERHDLSADSTHAAALPGLRVHLRALSPPRP